ncbi:SufB/SufD family protein [Desulfatibacillum aliphaticivorans]|uniref:SufB/SufD family protein n=1 Tax=Desulfatibacillum aliphaticivorans TaxID=218208 RepID=UPI00040170CC|nr:SufD family Fe-S cluster assembly protein [Desulfatibacillum aliphaticivorans]
MKNDNQAKNPRLSDYQAGQTNHEYLADLKAINPADADKFLSVGVDASEDFRAGTFIVKDQSVLHSKTKQKGVDIMSITQAKDKFDLSPYLWKGVDPGKDEYTSWAHEQPAEGYFIRSQPGQIIQAPVQSCLYIEKEQFAQNVHNLVIAEEGSHLSIINGCATSPHLISGLHVGITEFYVKKGAVLSFTMIHDWGKEVNVRPRTVGYVEEGGVLISNYISLRPVGSLQMSPTTHLRGRGAIARFNSILVADKGSTLDVGSNVILEAPETKAEIISRAITFGGDILAKGKLVGLVPEVKAHLECKGLILKDGLMLAIPELEAHVPGVEMSHEAAVGKIDNREIEYLMARGLTEEEAVSTIVRGFLNVDIEGLPSGLKQRLDKVISETEKDMF